MLSQLSNNLFKVIQQYTVFRNPPLQFRRFLTRTYKQTIFAPGSYITLPEVPSLPTGEILNPLYDADYVPNFKNVKPIYIANALMEQCDEMEVKLNEIIHIASDPRRRSDYKLISSLYENVNKLVVVHKLCRGISGAVGTDCLIAYLLALDTFEQVNSKRFTDINIYLSTKELLADRNVTDVEDIELLKYHNLLAYMNGCSLTEKSADEFAACRYALMKYQQIYNLKLSYCTLTSNEIIDNPTDLEGLPDQIIRLYRLPSCNRYRIPLRKKAVEYVQKYCKNRNLRRRLTKQLYGIASRSWCTTQWDNGSEIKHILGCRHKLAELLGYKSASEAAMLEKSTMQNLDEVKSTITCLKNDIVPTFKANLENFQKFINTNKYKHDLETCDLLFYAHQMYQEDQRTNYQSATRSSEDRQLFLSVNNVVSKLLKISSSLLNFQFKDISDQHSKKLLTPHAKVFEILMQDPECKKPAALIVDFGDNSLLRTNADVYVIRENTQELGALSYLKLPIIDRQIIDPWMTPLSAEQISEIAFKLGYLILSCAIHPTTYSDFDGLHNKKEDIAFVFPFVLKFLSTHPKYLRQILTHQQDNTLMSETMCQHICTENKFKFLKEFIMDLYISDFDLILHSSQSNYIDVLWKLWTDYFTFKHSSDEFFPCQLPEVFATDSTVFAFNKVRAQLIAANIIKQIDDIGGLTSLSKQNESNCIRFLRSLKSSKNGLYDSSLLHQHQINAEDYQSLKNLLAFNK